MFTELKDHHFVCAAKESKLDQIPKELLTPNVMRLRCKGRRSVLYYAAINHQLRDISDECFREENLLQPRVFIPWRGKKQRVPDCEQDELKVSFFLTHATASECLNLLPNDWVRTENFIRCGTSFDPAIWNIAKAGTLNLLPKEFITKECALIASNELDYGKTVMHFAARHGQLSSLPNSVVKENLVTLVDDLKRTPLHYAARYGQLSAIPKGYSSDPSIIAGLEKELLESTPCKSTLHYAAQHGQLGKLPPDFVNKHLTSLRDNYDKTPLACAAKARQLIAVPDEYLSEQAVMEDLDNSGKTICDILMKSHGILKAFKQLPRGYLRPELIPRVLVNYGKIDDLNSRAIPRWVEYFSDVEIADLNGVIPEIPHRFQRGYKFLIECMLAKQKIESAMSKIPSPNV